MSTKKKNHLIRTLSQPLHLAQASSCVMHLPALTRNTLSTGIGLPVTGVGVAGRAAVHSAQQGAQVAHRHLLYEGSPIFPKIPPLKDLRQRRRRRKRRVRFRRLFLKTRF